MKQTIIQKCNGFTLAEILVAVLIIAILATMAVPMYERTIEKSRLAEVSTKLKQLGDAKLRLMDAQDIPVYSNYANVLDDIARLDIKFTSSPYFDFLMYPNSTYANAVCAIRSGGVNQGTQFLYLGETASQYCPDCEHPGSDALCIAYCSTGQKLLCKDASTTKPTCEAYGMVSTNFTSCDNQSYASF